MLRNDGEKAQNILTKFMSKICSYRDPSFSIKTKLFIETSNIYYRMRRTVLIMRLCLLHTNVAYTKSFMKFYKIIFFKGALLSSFERGLWKWKKQKIIFPERLLFRKNSKKSTLFNFTQHATADGFGLAINI